MTRDKALPDWRQGPGVEEFFRLRLGRLKKNTIRMYALYLKKLILHCCDVFDCTPDELDFARCMKGVIRDRIVELPIPYKVVEDFIQALPESERPNGRSCLNVYFNFLVTIGKIPHNPVRQCAQTVRKQPPKRSLSVQEILQLVDRIKEEPVWIRAPLLTQFASGMRVSELINLRTDDMVSTESGWIVYIRRGSVKTHKFWAIPLPSMDPIMHPYLDWRRQFDTDTYHLFVDPSGKPLTLAFLNQVLKQLGEAAGCSRTVTTHDLRRGYAGALTYAMGTSETTRQLMRHKKEFTTMGYTAVPTPEEIRAALASVPSVQLAEKLARRWLNG
jgi:site-specific recombinase XerC